MYVARSLPSRLASLSDCAGPSQADSHAPRTALRDQVRDVRQVHRPRLWDGFATQREVSGLASHGSARLHEQARREAQDVYDLCADTYKTRGGRSMSDGLLDVLGKSAAPASGWVAAARLVEAGYLDVNAKDSRGNTLLQLAIMNGAAPAQQLATALLHRADVMLDAPVADGTSLLALAQAHGSASVVGQVERRLGLDTSKRAPYFSERRNWQANWNGEVKVGAQPIWCRHLTMLWEQRFMRTHGKLDYRDFSPARLKTVAAPLIDDNEAACHARRMLAQCRLVPADAWGEVIADTFQAMEASGETGRTIMVETLNHAMALGLKIKADKRGGRSYVVQFYDPNATVAHERSSVSAAPGAHLDPAVFRQLTASDFLSKDAREEYELVGPGVAAFLGKPVHGVAPRLDGGLRQVDAQTMHHLLRLNLADGLRGCAASLSGVDARTGLRILAARREEGNVPGLLLALQEGHADAIQAYGEILVQWAPKFSREQIKNLLEAKTASGVPGLLLALQDGRADAIEAYGELLVRLAPRLSADDLAHLLAAQASDGSTGLQRARGNGRTDAIRVFDRVVDRVASRLTALRQERQG